MKFFNEGAYWNRTGSYSSTGLTETAKTMIDDAKWYLGGTKIFEDTSNGLASHFYSYERSTNAYSDNQTSWVGKVGLMYPSDFGYATSGGSVENRTKCLALELTRWFTTGDPHSYCKSNDWLYYGIEEWTISPYIEYPNYAFLIASNGFVYYSSVNNTLGLRPCVYLKSNVLINGGTGTESDPYQLSL